MEFSQSFPTHSTLHAVLLYKITIWNLYSLLIDFLCLLCITSTISVSNCYCLQILVTFYYFFLFPAQRVPLPLWCLRANEVQTLLQKNGKVCNSFFFPSLLLQCMAQNFCVFTLRSLVFAASCRLGEWGDHVTLQAAADKVWCIFQIITSFRKNYIDTPWS